MVLYKKMIPLWEPWDTFFHTVTGRLAQQKEVQPQLPGRWQVCEVSEKMEGNESPFLI